MSRRCLCARSFPGAPLIAGSLALVAGCPPALPAPLVPVEGEAGAEAGIEEMQLAAGIGAERVEPSWLPGPVSEVTPQLGQAARVLTPRMKVVNAAPDAEVDEEAGEEEVGPDRVVAELWAVGLTGEQLWFSKAFPIDASACDPELQLAEIEGVENPGHYMFQLTCTGGGDRVFVDSYTMLVRADLEEEAVRLLWEGRGISENAWDACLSYDVISFQVSEDGQRVRALRDRETLRTREDDEALEMDCAVSEFEQIPVAEIDLQSEIGEAVVELELPVETESVEPTEESSESPETLPTD